MKSPIARIMLIALTIVASIICGLNYFGIKKATSHSDLTVNSEERAIEIALNCEI